jgi:hypothetical protein
VSAPRLWELVPAVHRVRDAEQGYPLRSLLGVMQREVDRLGDDVEQLYENWFVETCQDWVVPYLADLLGVRGLQDVTGRRRTQRGLVANTIAYRRRKGTAAVIEQLAADVTGWPARAVEFFQLLGWTQNVNHVRPGSGGTADVRLGASPELVGGPFDRAAHTAEVRHIDNGRGRHNIPYLGAFLWRLASYDLDGVQARPAAEEGRYLLSPLGLDTPLFNRPRAETDIGHLAEERNVPGPLRRRPLHDELAADRAAEDDDWFAPDDPVVAVTIDGALVPRDELAICNLEDGERLAPEGKVAIDPELGRLALEPGADVPDEVRVSYSYGFSGDLGGGPYDRRESLMEAIPEPGTIDWQMGVTADPPAGATELAGTLGEALAAYEEAGPKLGLIVLMDSSSNEEAVTIEVSGGATLVIAAARWDTELDPLDGLEKRVRGHFTPADVRPHVLGDVTVRGEPPEAGADAGRVVIDGLLIEGALTIADGQLGKLRLAHSTLVPPGGEPEPPAEESEPPAEESEPPAPTLALTQGNTGLDVEIVRSITGPIALGGDADDVTIRDSIVDADGALAIAAHDANLEAITVLGTSDFRSLHASDSIFTGRVTVERRQVGCVRHSYLPADSLAPRRYRCRPETSEEAARVVPAFTSETYGQPGYAQLAAEAPPEILTGADDEGEMGAFNFLESAHRLSGLHARLDEYLRFGLEAGVFFVT